MRELLSVPGVRTGATTMNTIYYRGYIVNMNEYAGFWGIYKNQTFLTLSTQDKAIQWIDLQIDHFSERVFTKKTCLA